MAPLCICLGYLCRTLAVNTKTKCLGLCLNPRRPLLDIRNPVIQLYKTMSKEVPRVLTIYDADIPVEDVSASIPCSVLVRTYDVY